MALHWRADGLAALRVPQTQGLVEAARDGARAIGAERDGQHWSFVSVENAQQDAWWLHLNLQRAQPREAPPCPSRLAQPGNLWPRIFGQAVEQLRRKLARRASLAGSPAGSCDLAVTNLDSLIGKIYPLIFNFRRKSTPHDTKEIPNRK